MSSEKDVVKAYVRYLKLQRNMSGNTLDAYQRDLRKLLDYLEREQKSVRDVELVDLEHFSAGLHDIGIHPRSQCRILSGVRSFFKFLQLDGFRDDDPTELLESPQIGDHLPEVLTTDKLAPKELIYVASEEDPVLSDLFEKNPEVIEGWGKMIGFHVIYLPLLMKRLADEKVLKYRAPYLSDAEVATASIGNDFILKHLENPNDRKLISQGFMRTEDIHRSGGKDQAINRFYPISSASSEPIADQLHRIGKQIALEGHKGHGSRFQIDEKRLDDYQRASLPPSKSSEPDVYYDEWDACEDMGASVTPSFDADQHFNSQQMGENTDDLIEEIKERIAKLRQRGIAEYILEQLIHPDDRLSRLVITKDYRIVLPDYNNMEIKMEPLVKAVYLLFLKHPEGLLFKHLPDYRKELTAIYNKLKPFGLSDRALQSIEDVTNPLLNSINEKCARIRGAFVGQFDNYMAKNYYIDGVRGEAKKISLPRNLVIWE